MRVRLYGQQLALDLTRKVPVGHGATELLQALAQRGLKMAVATSASRRAAERHLVLSRLCEQFGVSSRGTTLRAASRNRFYHRSRAGQGRLCFGTTNQTAGQTMDWCMREIGAFEAKTKLSRLRDRVEAGEEIVITRRGKAVAKLVPPDSPGIDRERARNAARGLRAIRKGITLGGLKMKDLISEGRL